MSFFDKVQIPTQEGGQPVQGGFFSKVKLPSESFDTENYLQFQREGEAAQRESERINSFGGQVWEGLKSAPRHLWDYTIGGVPQYAMSLWETPGTLLRGGRTTDKTYDWSRAGIRPFKSLQSEMADNTEEVFEGTRTPIGAMGPVAKGVLQPLEMLGVGKVAPSVVKTVKNTKGLKETVTNVGKDIATGFFPSTRQQAPLPGGQTSKFAQKVQMPEKQDTPATSVVSYINANDKKVYTRVSAEELERLKDEVKNIPEAKPGASQIHLDADTPMLREIGEEIPRDDFLKGHPQAKEVMARAEALDETFSPKTGVDIQTRAVERALVRDADDFELPSVSRMNLQDQAAKAVNFIAQNKDDAIKVAMGKTNAPGDLRAGSVFTALREDAVKAGDVKLLQQLSRSTVASEMAQELKAFDVFRADDPVKIFKQIINARTKKAAPLLGNRPDKAVEKTVRTIKRTMKKQPVKRESWEDFINKIKCNY